MIRKQEQILKKIAYEWGFIYIDTPLHMFGKAVFWFWNMIEAKEWFEHNKLLYAPYFYKQPFFICCTIHKNKYRLVTKNRYGKEIMMEFKFIDNLKKAVQEEQKRLLDDMRNYNQEEKIKTINAMLI